MKPIRVQRKRTTGYRMPENTVSVTRPGRWGNPFKVTEEQTAEVAAARFRAMMLNLNAEPVSDEIYARFRYMRDRIRDLEGKNLACFCNVGANCHAEILLELANQ